MNAKPNDLSRFLDDSPALKTRTPIAALTISRKSLIPADCLCRPQNQNNERQLRGTTYRTLKVRFGSGCDGQPFGFIAGKLALKVRCS